MSKLLGIDIGGTNIKYALLEKNGEIFLKDQIATPACNLADFLAALYGIVDQFEAQISGIGISAPGKIDSETGMISFGGALPFLHGCNLKELLSQKYQLSVEIENDAKACALAEYWLGSLAGFPSGAVLVLGTGVGCGVILDGKISRGTHGQCGEVSFMIGRPEAKGMDKLVGTSCSSVNLISQISDVLSLPADTDGKVIFKEIRSQRHPQVNQIFMDYCTNLATLLLNIQAMLDLPIFAIGGGISNQPIVIETLNRQYDLLIDELPIVKETISRPNIVKATYGSDANLIGAVYHLLDRKDEIACR
ncbi:ROK family protein [Listeria costaricensis]|uniref:ROK family protein n=1 Tax=Listeria costaricensis TaxID=2026604 RepID=UPI000C0736E0|nr:ROK family protein [Listeria costaricensis]